MYRGPRVKLTLLAEFLKAQEHPDKYLVRIAAKSGPRSRSLRLLSASKAERQGTNLSSPRIYYMELINGNGLKGRKERSVLNANVPSGIWAAFWCATPGIAESFWLGAASIAARDQSDSWSRLSGVTVWHLWPNDWVVTHLWLCLRVRLVMFPVIIHQSYVIDQESISQTPVHISFGFL